MGDVERRFTLAEFRVQQIVWLIEHYRTAGVRVRECFTEGIATLEQQASRHTTPEFKGHRVVVALCSVINYE